MPFKCPAAPYEAAFLAESFLRRKGIRRNVEIHLFTPEHTPMPVAPAALGDSIADMLAARGIHYHPLFTFKELRPETREVVASDGRAHRVDLLMGVPPHQAPEVMRSSPLLGVSGFVHVDPRTLQTDYDDVYAIGDVATIKLPNGKALPKAGVFAHAEAKVGGAADRGRRRGQDVRRRRSTATATAGSSWATGEPGSPAATSTPSPNPRSRCGDPGARCTGARWPSRSGGSTTGLQPQRSF